LCLLKYVTRSDLSISALLNVLKGAFEMSCDFHVTGYSVCTSLKRGNGLWPILAKASLFTGGPAIMPLCSRAILRTQIRFSHPFARRGADVPNR
jgi:hypothetical protein